jgi:hypothetical protein
MSSERRIKASQENGRLSHGPTSAEGKRRSSQNAIRHGMLAATVVLPAEAQSGFKDLTDSFYGRFQPADNVEVGLIEDMCAAWWKTRRGWAIENRLLSDAIDVQRSGDELGRMTGAFRELANSREFPLIHRYETRFQLQFHRALNNLLALRKAVAPDEFPGPNGPVFEHPTNDPEPPSNDPPLLPEPQSNQPPPPENLAVPNEPSPICGHLGPKSRPDRTEAPTLLRLSRAIHAHPGRHRESGAVNHPADETANRSQRAGGGIQRPRPTNRRRVARLQAHPRALGHALRLLLFLAGAALLAQAPAQLAPQQPDRSEISSFDIRGHSTRTIFRVDAVWEAPNWSPGGRWLACAHQHPGPNSAPSDDIFRDPAADRSLDNSQIAPRRSRFEIRK